MAINPAAETTLGAVDVHAAQILKAHQSLELGEGAGTGLGAAQVIAGGEGVTGVETDADARLVLDAVDNGRQMLE